jgi:hypothetical protein
LTRIFRVQFIEILAFEQPSLFHPQENKYKRYAIWIIVVPWRFFAYNIYDLEGHFNLQLGEDKEEPVQAINQIMALTPFYVPFDRVFKEIVRKSISRSI